MNMDEVFNEIKVERVYQRTRWEPAFDRANTPNDWVACITKNAGRAVMTPFNFGTFQAQLIKIASLAIAALEQDDYAPRHYDDNVRLGRVKHGK